MLRGICTLSLFAADLAEAEAWYTGLLGREPYFRKEFGRAVAYLEGLGDRETELGLLDARYAPTGRTPASGIVAYWAVEDVHAAFADLVGRGATVLATPTQQGPGFVTAAVADPFGNVLGVMKNVHYESQA